MRLFDRVLKLLHLVRLDKHRQLLADEHTAGHRISCEWRQRFTDRDAEHEKDLLLATDIVHKLGVLRYTQSGHRDMRVWMVTYSISEHDMRAFSQGDTDAIHRVSKWIGWQIGRDLAAGNHWRCMSTRNRR